MNIELSINGTFELNILSLDGNDVSEKIHLEVGKKLQSGEYVIGMSDNTICDLKALNNPLYKFTMDVDDCTEYDFELTENDISIKDADVTIHSNDPGNIHLDTPKYKQVELRYFFNAGDDINNEGLEVSVEGEYVGEMIDVYLPNIDIDDEDELDALNEFISELDQWINVNL